MTDSIHENKFISQFQIQTSVLKDKSHYQLTGFDLIRFKRHAWRYIFTVQFNDQLGL